MGRSFYRRMITLVAVLLLMAVCNQLVLILLSLFKGVDFQHNDELMALLEKQENILMLKALIGLNHIMIFIAGPLIYLKIIKQKKYTNYLSLKHFDAVFLYLFPLALLSLYPLMGYITFYMSQWDYPTFMEKIDQESMELLSKIIVMEGPLDFTINLILIGVLPALGEELLFRGIIQQELTHYWKKNHWAIWFTSFLFAAFHFQVVGFVPKMIIGLVLGYALYYSKSLWLPMLLHFMNNSFTLWSAYISESKLSELENTEKNIPFLSVVISFSIFGFLFYQIRSVSIKNNTPDPHDQK